MYSLYFVTGFHIYSELYGTFLQNFLEKNVVLHKVIFILAVLPGGPTFCKVMWGLNQENFKIDEVYYDQELVLLFFYPHICLFFLIIEYTAVTLANKTAGSRCVDLQHIICALCCALTTPSHVSVHHHLPPIPSSTSLYPSLPPQSPHCCPCP